MRLSDDADAAIIGNEQDDRHPHPHGHPREKAACGDDHQDHEYQPIVPSSQLPPRLIDPFRQEGKAEKAKQAAEHGFGDIGQQRGAAKQRRATERCRAHADPAAVRAHLVH